MMIMKKRKAILHLFESIFAAFIISGYFFFAFSSYEQPLVQKEMITENKLKTESYSFLSSMKYTNITYFIETAQEEQLNSIFKYFIGINRGFSLATDGLPRKELKIGVVSTNFQRLITANPPCTFVPAIDGAVCHGILFSGKNIAIANLSSNETNALFVNDGSDWEFERVLGEGPFLERTIVNISDDYYGFSINDASKEVLLFEAEDAIKLTDKLSTHLFNESYSCLNDREIEFTIRPASMEEDYDSLSKNDILFFYNYRNLNAYKEKLINFIDDEKALVEITDSSLSCDDVQTELFNLQPGYNRLGNDKNITINTESMNADIGNYLMDNELTLKTKRYTPDLDFIAEEEDEELNDSIDGRTAFVTKIGVNNTLWNIILVKNGGTYSHAYFSNQTNFTGKPGNISHNVGEEIAIGPYNYTIESIHPEGIFIKLKNAFEKFRFPDKDTQMPFVYARPTQDIFRDDESFVLLKQNRTYNITTYDIGKNITNTTGFLDLDEDQARAKGIFCPGNATGYTATITNISLDPSDPIDSRVGVAVADCPNAYSQMDTLYIDHTNNSYFNDSFEGPFNVFEGNDVLRIDSEYYKIKILKPSGVFNLTLIERWHVPAAIINDVDKKGITLWMVDPQNSSDGWSVLRSTLAAFSNKKHHIILPMPSRRNSIFIEDLFFSKGDIFIPYTIKTGVWYP
ncbi:MAG: hypothetical protein KAR87_00495 [Candidatus Aenigmarchaeota archaeon]|nr:hypothetical protein [Candidatus Aenigmarchaeota archaeon]